MRVFVTGATGFVGSAVVAELVGAGHEVVGLARSDEGEAAVRAAGAQTLRGNLADLDCLRRGAEASDGTLHCGFNHDWSNFAANCEMDRMAIEAMGEALAGTNKPLIVSSGVALLAPGALVTEDTPMPSRDSGFPRVSEQAALAFASRGVSASAIRLAPTVHGEGDHGFVPRLIDIAREKGAAVYVGEGKNHWPAVHRRDAARLYRLVLEAGQSAADRSWHAIAEEGVPFRDITQAIGRRLRLPLVSKTPEEAREHFGFFAMFAGIDCRASSAHTQATLGWTPVEAPLLEDLDQPYYFAT